MVVFTFSGLNLCVPLVLFVIGYYKDLSGYYYLSSVLVMLLNQSVNPYIYCIRYKEFQIQMKMLFCRYGANGHKSSVDKIVVTDVERSCSS